MRLLIEMETTPPKLVGCRTYHCNECIWDKMDRPKCDGKVEYDRLLKVFKSLLIDGHWRR